MQWDEILSKTAIFSYRQKFHLLFQKELKLDICKQTPKTIWSLFMKMKVLFEIFLRSIGMPSCNTFKYEERPVQTQVHESKKAGS